MNTLLFACVCYTIWNNTGCKQMQMLYNLKNIYIFYRDTNLGKLRWHNISMAIGYFLTSFCIYIFFIQVLLSMCLCDGIWLHRSQTSLDQLVPWLSDNTKLLSDSMPTVSCTVRTNFGDIRIKLQQLSHSKINLKLYPAKAVISSLLQHVNSISSKLRDLIPKPNHKGVHFDM